MTSQSHPVKQWQHHHQFSHQNSDGERNTLYVLILTIITMLAEIIAGSIYGSMALLADGWHMGTHAAAFMITLFAYRYSRKNADNPQFSFGTGKVSVLGGFTSAIALGMVALIMLVESLVRIINPEQIYFNQAIFVAFIGLTVNIVSVFLLKDHHSHDHHHAEHEHEHEHEAVHHHDHNLRAAYFHVLADALTSVLAIVALVFGKYMGLTFLDPVMGIVGAVIITRWAWGLMKQTSPILLDNSIGLDKKSRIKHFLEHDGVIVTDLHIWKVSAEHYAAIVSLLVHSDIDAVQLKQQLESKFSQLSHITIEINQCPLASCKSISYS
ncbi:CDF family Co(II)/Ni(II) efflux transporter DmeF [Shewanella sp. SG41-3]|uniref:CDF family Co(II)/Ni(II) efflux transporter DmeF n=1 Tax=Shewanella sp. SG41-3 TaxID=2760977 RepID=UPI001602675D|nr:CDF family Co(II)/Ni(II) efflux transporter DmeF [Shewanella sp. SG41-3]MBB1474021.1 CDF family Co(II)/Ni(II) efflux transporter DmeF [Shewanella sp. SG41-3]